VLLRMQIKPGRERDFEHAWLSIGTAVTSQSSNIAQWLLRGADDDGAYYIVSDWTDEASFRDFERSPAHLEHRQQLHPYREAGSMQTMVAVYHLRGAARAVAAPV
jgi:heme oxygenase (mycobilin-producing)